MKSLSIIFYAVGAVLLIISCFTTGVTVTWILGGLALIFLIVGCVFQYKVNVNNTRRARDLSARNARHHYQ